MIVLGVDPGSRVTGYGVVQIVKGQEQLVEYGVLKLDVQKSHQWRLKQVYDRLLGVIDRCLPDACAVEMPVYGKNPQAMLKLARVQAVAMLAALNREIPVVEYTPKEVKKSATGKGNASKEQVWYMTRAVLNIADDEKVMFDASDALAVALCHAHRGAKGKTPQHDSWDSFLSANQHRIIG
ncbi:MAG: crossover junction endodeoxyribonuclease RuvC [Bacteroidota bacterium]